jgi:hypothetical protein
VERIHKEGRSAPHHRKIVSTAGTTSRAHLDFDLNHKSLLDCEYLFPHVHTALLIGLESYTRGGETFSEFRQKAYRQNLTHEDGVHKLEQCQPAMRTGHFLELLFYHSEQLSCHCGPMLFLHDARKEKTLKRKRATFDKKVQVSPPALYTNPKESPFT